jgi:hypothetical protein
VALSHQGGEEALPPRLSKGVTKSGFGRVKEVDPLTSDGPYKGGVDLDREEGQSFPHPIKDGHAAIGWASKDATESEEFGREKAVTVSRLANSIGPAEPSLTRNAVDAPGIGQKGWVGVWAQKGRKDKGGGARRPYSISTGNSNFHLGKVHGMNGREFGSVECSREEALPNDGAVRNGSEGEFAFGRPFAKGSVAFDASAQMPTRGGGHGPSVECAGTASGLFGRGEGNVGPELAAGIYLVAARHKKADGMEQGICTCDGLSLICGHGQLDGGEISHEGPIFFNGCVDTRLEGVVSGHERNIIHENTMNDFIRPRSLLRLCEHREKIEFQLRSRESRAGRNPSGRGDFSASYVELPQNAAGPGI